MLVDPVFKARITRRGAGRWPVEDDRAAIGQDEPAPGEQHAALAVSDLAVIVADQPRALRDQQNAPSRAVIDILRYLSRDLSRQVGTDAGDAGGGDDVARLNDMGRDRIGQLPRVEDRERVV